MDVSPERPSDGWKFRNPSGLPYRVCLAPSAADAMVAASVTAGRRETGGILIGRHASDGWTVEVAEATPKPKGSIAGWFSFRRGHDGLQRLLESRWLRGEHYLGEWHFHPGAAPAPSCSDNMAMEQISLDPAYACVEPLLIIIGGKPPDRFEISATIYPRGAAIPLRRS